MISDKKHLIPISESVFQVLDALSKKFKKPIEIFVDMAFKDFLCVLEEQPEIFLDEIGFFQDLENELKIQV